MPNACSIVCTYTRESVPYRECTHLNSPRCITGRDVGTIPQADILAISIFFCLNCKLSFCNCKIYLMQLQKVILTLHYRTGQYRRPHYLWLLWSGLRGVRQGLSVARIYRLKCDAFKSWNLLETFKMLWWVAEIISSHGHIFLTGNLPKWVCFWRFLRDFGGMGRMGERGGCAVCIGKHWSGGGSRILGEEN